MKVHRSVLDGLRVEPGHAGDLGERPTAADLGSAADALGKKERKAAYRDALAEVVGEVATLQERMYAQGTHAVLLVLQALDAAGKDSTIEHVLSGVNPQGCRVTSFKAPSPTELAHDFLWRVNEALPPRGYLGVFNRSHYEEVLVVRVHPELLDAQGLPEAPRTKRDRERLWKQRYASINEFERHLDRNGTRVLKVYLHVSKDEQRRRFLSRIDDPEKHWKFNARDLAERKLWDDYRAAYEATLHATSTSWAPWHVVPADDKPSARLLVAHLLLDVMKGLDLTEPKPTEEQRAALDDAKAALLAEQ